MANGTDRVDLLLVCSTGGHLLQLVTLREVWGDRLRAWVTFDKSDARSLLRDEQVFFAYGPTNRSVRNLLRNLLLAPRLVRRLRPRVVLTTGAGVAVPFAWVGRLFGARVVYVESFTRIEGPSLSCRLIAPVADRVYVQWPEMRRLLPHARFAGTVFARRERETPAQAAADSPGPVVVTVGTNEARFDRLLEAVNGLGGDEELVVQHGPSPVRPAGATCVAYLPFDELVSLIRRARVVVSHAGVGSVMTALTNGRRPVVVPRLARYGEAVDDHQLPFANRLEAAGLVRLVLDPGQLGAAIATESRTDAPGIQPDRQLVGELRDYLTGLSPAERPDHSR